MNSALLLMSAVVLAGCSDEQPVALAIRSPVPAAPASAASTTARATDRFATAKGPLVVSPLEHASVLFGWDGKAIYVDPTLRSVGDAELPKADVVFVTDVHYDHLDETALSYVERPGTLVVAPPEVADKTRVDVVMRNGDARDVLGVTVTAVPMYNIEHGPAPGLLYSEKGRANGYVLDFAGTRVYLAGDTECTPEMKALERIDVAFVGIGRATSMTALEATACVGAFRPKVLFPYHDRNVDLSALEGALAGRVEVRARDYYPRAAKMREEAFEACEKGRWGRCRDRLDRGAYIDPPGEEDPRVERARQQVRESDKPFPQGW
jgi:L-ascorbate metabolism protein UlaG (beta-lactamase superfamily)